MKFFATSTLLLLFSISHAQQTRHDAIYKSMNLGRSDSTKSGYKANINVGNVVNKEIEMELNDYALPHYRYDLKYSDWWFNSKRYLKDNAGLQISMNYTAIFMGASAKITPENQQTAAGGIFDLTLKWTFINKNKKGNKGSLVFWMDQRHIYYGLVAPQFLFLETGSATMNAVKFNKWKFHTLEFYYHQSVFNNSWDIVIGKIDMPDWFSFNGLAHPLLHFTDLAFSVNPAVTWSNPGFGVVVGGWLDKQKRFALVAGLNDVAGVDLSNPDFFDLGFDQWSNSNFLKMVEFQFTPGRSQYYANRIALTYWHANELLVEDESFFTTPSSQGFSIQGTWIIEDRLMPVLTLGLSDGEGANALSKFNLSAMNAWLFHSHDMLGVGLNFTTSSINNQSQFLTEVFYRWTWSKTTALTPVVKIVINPALNPNVDVMFYYGIRGRISM